MVNFVQFLSYCFLYAELQHAIQSNDIHTVNSIWCTVWPLFHSTNKIWYARLTMYVQHVLINVHPGIRNALQMRLISLKGESNHFFGPDMMTEIQNLYGR